MWEESLTIRNPFGLSVFGSALIKTPPDLVSIHANVARVEQTPSAAFSKARKAAHHVTDFLRSSKVEEFGVSRMRLAPEFDYVGGKRTFLGYVARIGFIVVVRDLERTEEVVSGLVDAGAAEVQSMEFQASGLREIRARARRLAIAAAREKAQIYADAAGVSVGSLLHIQDVNPQVLQGRGESHVQREPVIDNDTDRQTLDPGAIAVGAAVMVAFSLLDVDK